jgi:hypothetical protein
VTVTIVSGGARELVGHASQAAASFSPFSSAPPFSQVAALPVRPGTDLVNIHH